ncbi:MBOAT family O-acyltransferase [Alteromonas sediminis]|uniref:MBOAT family O-acyltransferase n=1 Tax=Alteromonas sediminis TaxID=2259342 RepID=UPI001F0BB959|nr:MBOAT family protein [Alteromonas sediminis]
MTIIVGSYLFYAWWRVDFLLLFALVTMWNFCIARQIHNNLECKHRNAKRWLTLGLSGNLSVLGYFKYANFGVESLNSALASVGAAPLSLGEVILPIGISFYIFQAISYLIDVYRKDTPPAARFIDFAAFISLFPQLIAGPVLRYKDLASQFDSRQHSWTVFASGVAVFIQGLIKKVLIADNVAPIADTMFAGGALGVADAWLGLLAYSVQLYFDFSGYSDMAIGLGLMMGFRFVKNFNQPYISQSITEFWRRWHISLSSWLRDYLYISLGGNRNGVYRTYRNLFLTMLLGGLWHGANWTFVVWGMWHGALLAIERYFGTAEYSGFSILRWGLTILLVGVGWVFFRADDLPHAMGYLSALFSVGSVAISVEYQYAITRLSVTTLFIACTIILLQGLKQHFTGLQRLLDAALVVTLGQWLKMPLFVLALMSLIASSYSPFLYFQF